AGRAGAGQRGGNFPRHVTRLTDAGGENRSGAGEDEMNRALELVVDRVGHGADRARLRFDHLARELSQHWIHPQPLDSRHTPTKINHTGTTLEPRTASWNTASNSMSTTARSIC